ncbi:MAG TPA: ECF-type sigma factor [Bryobacteraceae bacterium]|nr:ECF-type sigma factor [Bryobacteraceae bacterium]
MAAPSAEFTRRWVDFCQGSRLAAEELIQYFYPQLHRMAADRLKRERPGHTWQSTALIHELYLELIRTRGLAAPAADAPAAVHGEQAFLAFAGHLMKRLLILHARPLYRRAERVQAAESDLPGAAAPDLDAARDVESALEGLAAVAPELRSLVEWRVFDGLKMEDIARRMQCSERTAARRWDFARHWLRNFFEGRPNLHDDAR